mmetsp:Transcript_41682/g.110074  ORF Transcript_41682/g.110074 Transcript_41682/m.110074 type:complete len:218 (+) Transcript_41682:198-851(+)
MAFESERLGSASSSAPSPSSSADSSGTGSEYVLRRLAARRMRSSFPQRPAPFSKSPACTPSPKGRSPQTLSSVSCRPQSEWHKGLFEVSASPMGLLTTGTIRNDFWCSSSRPPAQTEGGVMLRWRRLQPGLAVEALARRCSRGGTQQTERNLAALVRCSCSSRTMAQRARRQSSSVPMAKEKLSQFREEADTKSRQSSRYVSIHVLRSMMFIAATAL